MPSSLAKDDLANALLDDQAKKDAEIKAKASEIAELKRVLAEKTKRETEFNNLLEQEKRRRDELAAELEEKGKQVDNQNGLISSLLETQFKNEETIREQNKKISDLKAYGEKKTDSIRLKIEQELTKKMRTSRRFLR